MVCVFLRERALIDWDPGIFARGGPGMTDKKQL